MVISTKGRYALRVMIELAGARPGTYLALRDIAGRQEISEKYLEAIMKRLVGAGLVSGLRGKGGGYRLAVDPERCTVGDILRAAEDSLSPVACLGLEGRCPRRDKCATLPIWAGLERRIADYLDGISLSELAAQARELEREGPSPKLNARERGE